MGAIQEPTADMPPWSVEIRRESFYLTAFGPAGELAPERVDDHALRFPVDHAPRLLSALDQVTGHQGWKEWTGTPRADAVTLVRDGDVLELRLPEPVYAQVWDDTDGHDTSVSTEIEYAHVEHLRAQLAAHA